MNYRTAFPLAALIPICLLAVVLWTDDTTPSKESMPLADVKIASGDKHSRQDRMEEPRLSAALRLKAREGADRIEISAVRAHPFPNVPQTRDGLPLEDDPFGASSVAEQAWLDRNGYPNALQVQEYTTAPDALLQLAADAGDEVAGVYLNFREFERGVEGAEDSLLYAAASGNSFALEMLSSFNSGSRRGDPISGFAFSRVLELQGNHAIGTMREFTMRTPLPASARLMAEAEARMIFNQFLEFRRETQGSTPSVDPRPTGG